MRRVVFALLALLGGVASAQPFDYLVAFPSEAAAIADPIVGQFNLTGAPGAWNPSNTVPNVLAWNPANDTSTSCGTGCTIVTHTPYDSNWLLLISLPARSAALEAESTTHIVYDSSQTGPAGLIYSWLPPATLASVMIQPVWQGRLYPFGNP